MSDAQRVKHAAQTARSIAVESVHVSSPRLKVLTLEISGTFRAPSASQYGGSLARAKSNNLDIKNMCSIATLTF